MVFDYSRDGVFRNEDRRSYSIVHCAGTHVPCMYCILKRRLAEAIYKKGEKIRALSHQTPDTKILSTILRLDYAPAPWILMVYPSASSPSSSPRSIDYNSLYKSSSVYSSKNDYDNKATTMMMSFFRRPQQLFATVVLFLLLVVLAAPPCQGNDATTTTGGGGGGDNVVVSKKSTTTTTTTLEGVLQFPDPTIPFNVTDTKVVLNHGERTTYSKPDGSFTLKNVGPGVHVVDVYSPIYHFGQIKIQLLPNEMNNNPKCLEYAYPGAPKKSVQCKPRLVLKTMATYDYFEKRQGFSLFWILKNPMVIMMLFSVGMMVR